MCIRDRTTSVPPGGATIVDFKVDVPGKYILVDHAIFRAFNKGAIGMLEVEGAKQPDLYSGNQADILYDPSNIAITPAAAAPTPTAPVDAGAATFAAVCA